jgi:outer membrane receptor for ferric coprogen and ferric-rhodotorulic acid
MPHHFACTSLKFTSAAAFHANCPDEHGTHETWNHVRPCTYIHAVDLRRCLHLAVLLFITGWTSSSDGAAIREETGIGNEQVPAAFTYPLKIDSRALADALQEFARQSGLQVIFFSELTEGLKAPPLDGQYTLETAMRVLLAQSHLSFRIINARTVQVRAIPLEADKPAPANTAIANDNQRLHTPIPIGPINPMEEVTVLAATEGLVATRVETPWREIPQTISVISREQLRQQNNVDLEDVLRHATGVTAQRFDSLDQTFYSRGFPITTFHIDGGAALTSKSSGALALLSSPDMSEFERVEVLRGADALFGGEGNPGATVNLIRKRPRAIGQVFVDAAVGSWGDRRIEADLTGPVALDGSLRGRVDVLGTNRNYFYDQANLQRRKISGALEYDLTSTTLFTIGGSYQRDDGVPVSNGIPVFADGRDAHIPRSAALQFDWANYQSRITEVYLKLNQSFDNDWSLKINGSLFRGTVAESTALFPILLNPVTHEVAVAPLIIETTHPNPFRQFALDATLSGVFQWFERREELALGADLTRQVQKPALRDFAEPPVQIDPSNIDFSGYPHPDATAVPELIGQSLLIHNSYGLFGSARIYLDDRWSIATGARVSYARLTLDSSAAAFGVSLHNSSSLHDSHVVTPYAGLMYKLDDDYTLYASYADIFAASSASRRADGTLIGPSHGENAEIGLKSVWRNGRLNASLTLYRIEQNNIPVLDDSNFATAVNTSGCCFRREANRSNGFDAELNGMIAEGWQFGGGYTLNVNHAPLGRPLSPITPRHLLKLWTSAQLPRALQRISVGATVYAQSAAPTSQLMTVPGDQHAYAVLDLRASVRLSENWLAAVSVNNIFDRVYYENTGSLTGLWYGSPRGYLLQLSGRY